LKKVRKTGYQDWSLVVGKSRYQRVRAAQKMKKMEDGRQKPEELLPVSVFGLLTF
jgi:hypothetical protein